MRGSLKLDAHPVAWESETVGNLTARGGRLRAYVEVAKAILAWAHPPRQTDSA